MKQIKKGKHWYFGMKARTKPIAFSTLPRCQERYQSTKKNGALIFLDRAPMSGELLATVGRD